MDFITDLSLSQLIFRNLDDESLLYASQISKKWLEVCKSIDIIIYDKCNRRILSFVIILTRELLLRVSCL